MSALIKFPGKRLCHHLHKVCINTWCYLTQPLGDEKKPIRLNPFWFSKAQFLEDCWQLQYSSTNHQQNHSAPDMGEF